MSVDKRLAQFLKGVKDRERRATSIPGLFLFKSPLIVVEQREKDRLAEAITDDVVRYLKSKKRDVIIMFQEPHGNWYAEGIDFDQRCELYPSFFNKT